MIQMWRTPLLSVRRWYWLYTGKYVYQVHRRETGELIGNLFSERLPKGLTKAEFDQWSYLADLIVDLRIRAAKKRRDK